jgi:UDP-GlcNAc:undecaprenyl-phosphate GlcNAc-1-phosphate transferase
VSLGAGRCSPAAFGSIAFIASLIGTYLARAVARRFGFVAKPKAERWHRTPTALGGGWGILIGFAPLLLFEHSLHWLLLGGVAMFTLGFVDDLVQLKPLAKLAGQATIATLTVVSGHTMQWTSNELINRGVGFFWIVGITNAINLLDNMDGLAAGVACVAALFQAIFFQLESRVAAASGSLALAGALLGFLIFNWNPASIFMGDCGALFVGYTLATLAIETSREHTGGLLSTLATPLLVMLVPIFDTTFVTLARLLKGQPVSRGGRDHTSHRLVASGLSEPKAVGVLIGLGLLGGAVATLGRLGLDAAVGLGAALVGVATAIMATRLRTPAGRSSPT